LAVIPSLYSAKLPRPTQPGHLCGARQVLATVAAAGREEMASSSYNRQHYEIDDCLEDNREDY